MSVISGNLLFCEGKPNSLDYRILHQLVMQKETNAGAATVIPAGGKYGLKAFVQGRLSDTSPEPKYLIFRDRDFDIPPPNEPGLIPFRKVFCTYRACIENYMLEAELLLGYWQEHEKAPKWKHGFPPPLKELRSWIETSAQDISDYQAVRWALASLKPESGWLKVENTWTKGSGHLPQSLKLCDCKREAEQLIKEFQDRIKDADFTRFKDVLENYRDKFKETQFWEKQDYLIWFHGKDLQKAMQKRKPNGISLDHFFKWAAPKMDYAKHPDLVQLSEKIKSL